MDTVNRLSRITIGLHWLIAITIIGLVALGLSMANFELYDYYETHKSIGILISGVIVIRVVWRISQGWPEHVSDYAKHEVLLAKVVHWTLIIATVVMPISGMMYSGASGHGFGIFGYEILAEHPDPMRAGEVIPLSEFWSNIGQNLHEYIGYLLILAIFLHVVGALKHHLVDKDTTLLRMLGKKKLIK
jgi:cytochrome b561